MDTDPTVTAMRVYLVAQHAEALAARARARAHRHECEWENGYLAALDHITTFLDDLSAAGPEPDHEQD